MNKLTLSKHKFLAAIVLAVLFLANFAPAAAIRASDFNSKPDEWFTSDEGKQKITEIISWQGPAGGWAKGYKADHVHAADEPLGDWDGVGTIDNNYTFTEIRFLARAYNLTKRQDALDSFNKGTDFLIAMQYPNGGFPQRFPLPKNYGRYITYNDNAMTNVMRLLEDINDNKPEFTFVDAPRRAKVKRAFDKGIDCIVKSQIVSGGKLTGWPQQCDPETLKPTSARAYELPSISGGESAGVAELLMRLDEPSEDVKKAVHAAAAWYEASKITGKRLAKSKDAQGQTDSRLVDDPSAEPLWARYYELETNRPFFCGRDGVKKYSYDEIERERRVGYAWYGAFGRRVLQDYPKWCEKHHTTPDVAVK
jgi:PelA/Pel-15E family pectate lyase